MRTVREAEVSGKRIVMRVDFNEPVHEGVVADDARIRAALPTIKFLLEKGASAITLLTHLGRPEGKVVEALRVAPLLAKLKEHLNDERITLKENLRFDPREESNDPVFAQELASLGDVFVNDAFADAHRSHASIVGIASLLPSYAGLLMEKEVAALSEALTPPKGSIAIIGGAKFETKEPLIKKLLSLYDTVLLGGALGNDVIKARGFPFGASLVSEVPVSPEIAMDQRLVVALDAYFVQKDAAAERTSFVNDIRIEEKIADIGPKTAALWAEKIQAAPFVLWNGPMGIYEEGFAASTDALAQALAQSKAKGVVGGGDTIAALSKVTFDPQKIFLSTGGGAMLQFLAEGTLPAIEALEGKK